MVLWSLHHHHHLLRLHLHLPSSLFFPFSSWSNYPPPVLLSCNLWSGTSRDECHGPTHPTTKTPIDRGQWRWWSTPNTSSGMVSPINKRSTCPSLLLLSLLLGFYLVCLDLHAEADWRRNPRDCFHPLLLRRQHRRCPADLSESGCPLQRSVLLSYRSRLDDILVPLVEFSPDHLQMNISTPRWPFRAVPTSYSRRASSLTMATMCADR